MIELHKPVPVLYEGKINKIEVPVEQDLIRDAQVWLRERLGDSAMMAHPAKDLSGDQTIAYDPTLLFTTEFLWDAYVDPSTFRGYFLIKGNDDISMLFKLTFGGRTGDH